MLNLIPVPRKLKRENGTFGYNYICLGKSDLTDNAKSDFISFCKKIGVTIDENEKNANIFFSKAEMKSESYEMEIAERIFIKSSDDAGAFYALQTLKQILLQSKKGEIDKMIVEDFPEYEYRGFMLDVGRYFYSVAHVKIFLDRMALHKLNTFHFHLTEDQGWRIEIKKYPLLTEKGSRRSHTNFGFKPESGFYTQEQIKEIVAYAHSKYIRVIPEFDIPGHTASALACYPELGCFGRKMNVKTHWGVKHDILCAGKQGTYQFVYDVLDEMIALFPDKVIHIGGDEAVKMRWELCPDCQKKMKDCNLKNMEEMQQHFMSVIDKYLASKGYSSMMWNWDLSADTENLSPSVAWNLCGCGGSTQENIRQEMNKGRKMVVTDSGQGYYLDLPYAWAPLKMPAEFDPSAFVGSANADNLIGVEAALWTEYVPNMKKADYMTYPRLGAIAISSWSDKSEINYDKFLKKLEDYYKLLDCYDVKYATPKQAMPSLISKKFGSLWFNRRQLHWQGLHNLIEDANVKRKYGKTK